MAFPKYNDTNSIKNFSDVNEELFFEKKKLFEFRIEKAVSKNPRVKPSELPQHIKRKIKHLMLKKKNIQIEGS